MATVLGLFDEDVNLEEIAQNLIEAGYDPASVNIISEDEEDTPVEDRVAAWGLSEDQAQPYVEGLLRGDNVLKIEAPDQQADQTVNLLQNYGATVVSGGSESDTGTAQSSYYEVAATPDTQPDYAQSNYNKDYAQPAPTQISYNADYAQASAPAEYNQSYTQPTSTTTAPLVDKLVAFQEGVVEIPTTGEVLDVNKSARVVEEVNLSKQSQDRVETVRDTVRRSNVDIQRINDQWQPGLERHDFTAYEPDFRSHFSQTFTNADTSTDFAAFEPAYHYGYDLANDQRYAANQWQTIEPQVQQDWEKYNPGTWEQVKDQIQYAWDKTRG